MSKNDRDVWYLKLAIVDLILAVRNVTPLLSGEAKTETMNFLVGAKDCLTKVGFDNDIIKCAGCGNIDVKDERDYCAECLVSKAEYEEER